MAWISELARRLRFLLRGQRFDQDLAEEMRLHLDLKAEEQRARGVDPAAAQLAARRAFGSPAQLQEASRDAWGWRFLDSVRQDVRYAFRNLAASPGFTATALLSLALGIGANTAIFSIIHAVLLRSVPVASPESLVQLKLGNGGDYDMNTPLWEALHTGQRALPETFAYSEDRFDLAESGESRFAQGIWTSGNYFRALGVSPLMGRTFSDDDDRWGGGRDGAVAVISYRFWQRYFAADAGAIGKTVSLNRKRFVVIGITPPAFTGLDVDHSFDIAIPVGAVPLLRPGTTQTDEMFHWWLRVLGRLPSGVTLGQAEDRLRVVTPQLLKVSMRPNLSPADQTEYLKTQFALTAAGLGFSQTRTQYRTALMVLMAIVGLVLLIACANLANLQLSRAAARHREISIRMAIGAGRVRVVRQLLTENLVLALLGAAGGLLFAMWGSRLLVRMLSTSSNVLDIQVASDGPLLGFTMAVAVLTAILFGLAPALRATRTGLSHSIKETDRGSVKGSGKLLLGKALVSSQVALTFVLLVGAGLFLGTLRKFLAVDPGFDPINVLLVSATLPQETTAADRNRLFHDMLTSLQRIPGIDAAGSSVLTPITTAGWAQPASVEGYTPQSRGDAMVFLNRISPGYLSAMRTPLLMGRDFDARDDLPAPPVALINETAARQFFGSANPLGRTVGLGRPGRRGEAARYQVVGVVKDTKYNRINEEQRKIVFLAAGQDAQPGSQLNFSARTTRSVEAAIPQVRAALTEVNRDGALVFNTLERQIDDSLLRPRMVALLSTVFGSLALLLAVIGLYGITSYAVAQRRAEIGIRMALGARPGAVVWLMLRDVAIMVCLGIGMGLAASLEAGPLVKSLLFGVRFDDPWKILQAAAVLVIAVALAAYLPARRASHEDPLAALREN